MRKFSISDAGVSRNAFHYAVHARGVVRNYGQTKVLKGLDMHVEVGKIYGLLGPSGCGKTSTIKCILGRLKLHGGQLNVFGLPPGSPGSNVPGVAVGYMPQELALYTEFSIAENLTFYAKIYGMPEDAVQRRIDELIEFLDLPPSHRLVKNLSGGQQRRCSLAMALLHKPKLLVLDEPTVGVDPLLRKKIWSYLVELAQGGTSIIITTHYIEEASAADCVGLMRDGKLLAEGNPQDLVRRYQCDSVEDVFLRLCQKDGPGITVNDNDERKNASVMRDEFDDDSRAPLLMEHASDMGGNSRTPPRSNSGKNSNNKKEPATPQLYSDDQVLSGRHQRRDSLDSMDAMQSNKPKPGCCADSGIRVRETRAMMWKNFKRMQRNVAFLVFQFFLPSIQVILFCLAIGKNPQHINVAIVNQDVGAVFNGTSYDLGKQFVAGLDDGSNFDLHYFDDIAHARDAVHHGEAWGVIHIPANFTTALVLRYTLPSPSLSLVLQSTVTMELDQSNEQISVFIEQQAGEQMAEILRPFPNALNPLEVGDPIYGFKHPKFTDFIAPGMVITIAFAQAIGLTAASFTQDKATGNMDRQWSAGVWPAEIMAAQLLSQFVMLFVQVALLLFFALFIFHLPMQGSLLLVVALSMLLGVAGMMYGGVISAGVEDEQAATQIALGSFFPVLLLSGIIWPIQAVPQGLRYISYALPTTWAADAMRSIMSRGWSMYDKPVWEGFVMTAAWISLLFLLSVKTLKRQVP